MERTETIYEQPLSELIRVSLRLENLFQRLDHLLAHQSNSHTQTIMILIIDILNVLDRPDLKTKFTKEFHRLIETLSKLHKSPNISRKKLNETLEQLKMLLQYFIKLQGKFGQTLKDDEFLSGVRQNAIKFGGCSLFDVPNYIYWLNLPVKTREKNIEAWLTTFKEIRMATELLLNIVRTSSEPCCLVAHNGFYHESLDPQSPCQLIRVMLPTKENLYPEIIAGKHRITIRFVTPDMDIHPIQTDRNVPFQLVKCII